jgi:hypothetical protein
MYSLREMAMQSSAIDTAKATQQGALTMDRLVQAQERTNQLLESVLVAVGGSVPAIPPPPVPVTRQSRRAVKREAKAERRRTA